MLEDLDKAEPEQIIILHVCAHNPTGCDPTNDQWDELLKIIVERKLFPFFDMAYQGFATSDFDADAYVLRAWLKTG